ncbi:signal peptide peptidase SppA [Apibacter adventoris]|uniref:signal peptide peptidase SppA n=1 Tax=Apibacter adventoris TaxID=1679466 RepID=UPI000CF69053|nr:signal peptide peptidase SppA [Apibacter adventoris]PQL93905.1 signal peptide peptidase SppA [Apibacter adventoris]
MKKFTIQVMATIVGILSLIGISVIGLILLGIIIPSLFSGVEDNSVLEITLNKPVLESPSEKSISIFSLEDKTNLYLNDILNLIKHAKTDEKIKGISLKLTNPDVGYSEISDIRQALLDFKESKKFVYAYSNDCSQKAYYLASVSDSLFLNPNAIVELTGLSTEIMFFKNLGEKYGIDFDVVRHGKYKSAVEPYLRNNLSEENRLQLTELLGNLWTKISTDIAVSRKVSTQDINISTDSLFGFISNLSLKHKLVDKLVNESEYDQIIKNKLGISKDKKINRITLSKYKENVNLDLNTKNKIAILYAVGEIYTGKGDDAVYSKTFIKQIKEIKEDENIKAVVLRINSPGGSANASAEILYELEQLKKVKPLIVSFGDVAASGGYYIAMAADKIYAQENTITGSIGVLGMIPNVKKLINNIGITTDYVTTNTNSLYYSPTQGMTAGMKDVMTQGIEITYKKFVGVVMNNRKMTFEQVDNLGQGRVWSGKQALDRRLVDEIGTFNDAIVFAAEKAKLEKYNTISYPIEKNFLESFFNKMESNDDDDIQSSYVEKVLKKDLGKDNYQLYQKIKNMNKNTGILYLMPFELSIK